MYAVIKTGGKQYRVQPGDLLVVEKLDGDVGAEVAFDQVLMLSGEGGDVSVGAPLVEGAVVRATLVETRRGDKIKVFKKIRRQGYRRTKGHRQTESVLRVTGLEGAGVNARWDGEVDLTPRSVLNLRARGLAPMIETAAVQSQPASSAPAQAAAAPAPVAKAAPEPAVERTEAQAPEAQVEQTAAEAAAPAEADAALLTDVVEPAPKKPRARKPKAESSALQGDEGGEPQA